MTITVKVDTRLADNLLRQLAKQLPYAAARALNATAKKAAAEANAAMPSVFQHASKFTQSAVGVPTFATKTDLFAMVAIKPLQAKYLSLEITGGKRTPASNTRVQSSALVLPGKGTAPLPSGFLGRLSQQAAAEVARRQQIAAGIKKRRKGSANRGIFKMSGRGPVGGPGGFFRRLPDHHLTRLISFEPSANYRPKLDFHGAVRTSVSRNLGPIFARELANALRTAK